MAKRKQVRSSKSTQSSNRRQTRTPIGNEPAASVRKLSIPLTEPFYVAVDRQLKSGYETYEAAEKAALTIKRQYPKLHVTVFDAKEQRHTLIEQQRPASASNKNRVAERLTHDAVERRAAAVVGGKR
ncbi:hypothetical protein [Bradyrhizobium sp.]|uniref:hypothetical protein n=1 Tax=Bradyrhizobium sp. TaxID=376 RepID=UPI003C71E91B